MTTPPPNADPLAALEADAATHDGRGVTVKKIPPLGLPATAENFPVPPPDETNPRAIFRNGFLRRGGGAILSAPSGVGKSTFSLQAALFWTLGKPAFGLAPVHPLRIVILESEDDTDEIGDLLDRIVSGTVGAGMMTADEADTARKSLRINNSKQVTNAGFYSELEAVASASKADGSPLVDLLIVNPLQTYFVGDISKNADVTAFLRGNVDPRIEGRVAILFVHHYNKPDAGNKRNGGPATAAEIYSEMMYRMAGGAELVNWARAVITFAIEADEAGALVYRLCYAKRGQRLGMTDADGKPTRCRSLSHAEAPAIYWKDGGPMAEREVGSREAATRREAPAKPADNRTTEEMAADLAAWVRYDSASGKPRKIGFQKGDVRSHACGRREAGGYGRDIGRAVLDTLCADPARYGVAMARRTEGGQVVRVFLGYDVDAVKAAVLADDRAGTWEDYVPGPAPKSATKPSTPPPPELPLADGEIGK